MNKKTKKTSKIVKPLTDRQTEVLLLLCKEIRTGEIAKRLKVSKKAIEKHRALIKIKTKARTNVGIYRYALLHGLVNL